MTVQQRVAIAELCEAAFLLNTSTSEVVKLAAGLLFERAAMLVRGSTEPHVYSDAAIASFAKHWGADVPARFAPDARKRS